LTAWVVGDAAAREDQALEAKMRLWRREDVTRATIYLGTGTCGRGAGALKTLKSVQAFLKDKSLDAEVIEVGCIGMCSAEPLLDVQLPGSARISFQHVTEKNAAKLLAEVFNGKIPADMVLGQFEANGLKAWDGVPKLSEHPFFAPQTRWVLAQCGQMDPSSMEEYIAHGGYQALGKVLRNLKPDEVCNEIDLSGLRGRGGGGFPTGRKWKFALAAKGDKKYIICNADEGDPGAFMDRAVRTPSARARPTSTSAPNIPWPSTA
jgi:(2Fe-2S) ferredoxin